MKKRLDTEEFYPVYILLGDDEIGVGTTPEVEIPPEKLEEYERVWKEWGAMQTYLGSLWPKGVH